MRREIFYIFVRVTAPLLQNPTSVGALHKKQLKTAKCPGAGLLKWIIMWTRENFRRGLVLRIISGLFRVAEERRRRDAGRVASWGRGG